jgi:hypothetical protein
VPQRAAFAAIGGIACFLAAFALGRVTGGEEAPAPPSLEPVPVAAVGLALPSLSEATPLPELAEPAPRARPAGRPLVRRRAPVPPPMPEHSEPAPQRTKPAPRPVVIVGSG